MSPRVRRHELTRRVVVAVAAAAAWLVLAGSAHPAEVIAAAVVGVATAVLGGRLRAYVGHQHAGLARWVRHLPRIAGQAYLDCWTLTVTLARRLGGRPIRGQFRTLPYRVGDDSPREVGRRVLTVIGVSLQPNSYAVAFDDDHDTILVHELEPTPTGPVPDELRDQR